MHSGHEGVSLWRLAGRFSSPAKAGSGEGEGEALEEIRVLMSTMVQQMQQLPDALKPSAALSPPHGEGTTCAHQRKPHMKVP